MTCNRSIELVSAAIDGELTDMELSEMEDHMAGCRRCRERSQAIRAADETLRSSPAPEQPSSLRAKVREKVGLCAPGKRHAVLHVPRAFERPEFPVRLTRKSPGPSPTMGPWGRA